MSNTEQKPAATPAETPRMDGRTAAPGVEYVSIAPATPSHPRND